MIPVNELCRKLSVEDSTMRKPSANQAIPTKDEGRVNGRLAFEGLRPVCHLQPGDI